MGESPLLRLAQRLNDLELLFVATSDVYELRVGEQQGPRHLTYCFVLDDRDRVVGGGNGIQAIDQALLVCLAPQLVKGVRQRCVVDTTKRARVNQTSRRIFFKPSIGRPFRTETERGQLRSRKSSTRRF